MISRNCQENESYLHTKLPFNYTVILTYTEKELESEEDDVDEEGQEYLKMLAKKVSC